MAQFGWVWCIVSCNVVGTCSHCVTCIAVRNNFQIYLEIQHVGTAAYHNGPLVALPTCTFIVQIW